MATRRVPMRRIREILRLKWVQGLSHRDAASSLGLSPGVVASTLRRAQEAGVDKDTVDELDDAELERRLYGARRGPGEQRPLPDPVWMHTELRRPGVTLELLHIEYLEKHPDGYRYTAFCENYRRWLKKRGLTMRQLHKAGEKAFVDYSGKRPEIIDGKTGEVRPVELFVVVLGASNLTYAEASLTQSSRDWIDSHNRAFEYFGGLPKLVVPDQLKSAVTSPCRYEPREQRTYAEWAQHCDTAILPARTYKPRDKAKVESGVLVTQRWVLARLRNQEFFSLAALNRRIRELVDQLNDRPMKSYGNLTRRQLFEQVEKEALQPLPAERFEWAEWKDAKVNIDYHATFDHHHYSVPHPLVHEAVEVRATMSTVEVFLRGKRVASHRRSYKKGGFTTRREHMPKAHQKHLEWTPSRLLNWAGKVGPNTQGLAKRILEARPHPEQGYRSCLGLMRLARDYGNERTEEACRRVLAVGAVSYRPVAALLKNGLDRTPQESQDDQTSSPIEHDNVRGPDYYR